MFKIKRTQPKRKKNEVILPYAQNLEDITAYAWHKMIEENDVNWIRIGFNGRQSKISDPILMEIKTKLEDEAFKIMNNDNYKIILSKRVEMNRYNDIYKVVVPILRRMQFGFQDDQLEDRLAYIKILKQLRFSMPELNSVQGDLIEIDRLLQQAEGIKTKIQLLADEIKTEGSKETRSLNNQMIVVGTILNTGYMPDPKKISQAYWLELQKTASEINEANKRNNQIKE